MTFTTLYIISMVANSAFGSDNLDLNEYGIRKYQAYEWYDSLSKSEQRAVQDNLSRYGEIMDQFNSLMIDMNESERIYIIEENNKKNIREQK